LHHPEELVGGANVGRILVLETDERVTGQGHHLPENEEEPHHVRRAEQAEHRRQKDEEIRIISGHPIIRVMVHVGDGIKRSRHRNQRRQQQKQRGQSIHMEAQGEANRRHLEKFLGAGGSAPSQHCRDGEKDQRRAGGGRQKGEPAGQCPVAGGQPRQRRSGDADKNGDEHGFFGSHHICIASFSRLPISSWGYVCCSSW
jgi:hypothetical protein